MKTAIIYATNNGCTDKCAQILATNLDNNTSILNIENYSIEAEKRGLIYSQVKTLKANQKLYVNEIKNTIFMAIYEALTKLKDKNAF